MFCPNCGAQIPENGKFCGRCGNPIASAPAPTQPPATFQPVQLHAEQVPYQQPWKQAPTTQPTYQETPQFSYQQQSMVPASQPYQAPDYQQWQAASTPSVPRRVKDDRGILEVLLLTFVTCGLYSFYFVYSMAQDMNTMCNDEEETPGLGLFILLSLATCGLYGIFWEYKIANRIARNAPYLGVLVQETGDTYLMWRLFGILLCGIGSLYGEHLLLSNMNKLARAYNARYGFI